MQTNEFRLYFQDIFYFFGGFEIGMLVAFAFWGQSQLREDYQNGVQDHFIAMHGVFGL